MAKFEKTSQIEPFMVPTTYKYTKLHGHQTLLNSYNMMQSKLNGLLIYGEIDLRLQADFGKLCIWRPTQVLYRYASVRKVCDQEERKKSLFLD
jgi:hypothetical protein